jgi:glycosyltransferase involved in cell wall biosynthesis
MKILAVMEALSLTGPGKNLVRFAQLAKAEGAEVIIATFRRKENPAEDDFVRAVRAADIQLEILSDSGPWDLSGARQMRQLLAELQIDLIQTHNVKSHFLMSLNESGKRIPWVAWNHGYTKPTWRQRIYNCFDYVSLRRASLVITVTEAFVSDLLRRGVRRERLEVVGNAIDPSTSTATGPPLRRTDYASLEQRIVLAVGRLSLEKAHASLIQTLAMAGLEDHVLVLVGDGPEREALEKLAAELGVKLVLAGQVSDVKPYYALADVFVLPSESEGSPNVLLEAMMAGLPILSTNVGGVKETVQDGQEAILVEPNQPQQMREGLLRFKRDPLWATQLGEKARSRVTAERSPEQRTRLILNHYRKLLQSRP